MKVGTATTINVPPVIGGEQKCTVTKNTYEQGNMNDNASSSNLETSELTDGKGEALEIDGHNIKQDVVNGNPASKSNNEKTRAVSSHGGSESSSCSSGSKYQKGEIIFMDSITTYPSKSFDGRNLVAGTPLERKMPSTSEELSSVQDWLESESVTSFGGLSRTSDAGISEVDCRKILRKIDELRNQLIRTRIRSRGLDMGDHARGADRAGSCHQFDSFVSVHSRQSSQSISQHSFSMVETNNKGHIQSTSMLLQPTQSHCLSRDHDQASGHSGQGPSSSGIYRNSCHMCSKPLKADGFQYFAPTNPVRHYHNAQRHKPHNHEMQNRNSKMEQLGEKRHCRPILGGSSFISCYKCLRVLEMPDDFQYLMRTHAKLRCGFCLEVLKFSFYKKTKVVPYSFTVEQIPPTELEDDSNTTLPERGAPSPNHYSSRSWVFPYSNEYDLSPSSIYSMEGENTTYRGTCEIQVPLHSLMGYISASEVLYQDLE